MYASSARSAARATASGSELADHVVDQRLTIRVEGGHLRQSNSHGRGITRTVNGADEHELGVLDRDLLLHGHLDVGHRVEVAEQVLDLVHAETDRLLATAVVGKIGQLGEAVRAQPRAVALALIAARASCQVSAALKAATRSITASAFWSAVTILPSP